MNQSHKCFERGMTAEQAAKEIDLAPYDEWPEAERFVANVAVAYRELRGTHSDEAPLARATARRYDADRRAEAGDHPALPFPGQASTSGIPRR